MDLSLKKVQLIEWLSRLQDERLIGKIEAVRKDSVNEIYNARFPKNLQELQGKLDQSERAIHSGHVHSQEEVEDYFKGKFKV